MSKLYLPAGSAGSPAYEVEITPESAGWGYSSLKIVSLPVAGTEAFETEDDEVIIVPLSGAVSVESDGSHVDLDGRASVFSGPTDVVYIGIGQTVTLHSERGGRFAICGARTEKSLPLRYLPAAKVPVELRGAGQASRQVRNFGTPDALPASKIIACEVITPGGNWSSYPAHKHDQASEHESELEEIYYFEIAAGPGRRTRPGLLPDLVLTRKADRHPRRGPRPGHGAGAPRLARTGCRGAGSRHVLLECDGRTGSGAGVEDLRSP